MKNVTQVVKGRYHRFTAVTTIGKGPLDDRHAEALLKEIAGSKVLAEYVQFQIDLKEED